MPKKRFPGEQIAFALRQAEAGTAIGDICRKMGAAEVTLYPRSKEDQKLIQRIDFPTNTLRRHRGRASWRYWSERQWRARSGG